MSHNLGSRCKTVRSGSSIASVSLKATGLTFHLAYDHVAICSAQVPGADRAGPGAEATRLALRDAAIAARTALAWRPTLHSVDSAARGQRMPGPPFGAMYFHGALDAKTSSALSSATHVLSYLGPC